MSLASWMRETAYRAAVTGTDSYGKPSYGTPVRLSVRTEKYQRMVRNSQGEEVASSHKLWCLSAIGLTDRVWLPGANPSVAGEAKLPLSVQSVSDKPGARTLFEVVL